MVPKSQIDQTTQKFQERTAERQETHPVVKNLIMWRKHTIH
jgi:hypothetical protein